MNTHEKISINQHYKVECFDKNGNAKWNDNFDNIVVTTGRNQYLDATLKTGVTSPLWYIGLKNATPAVAVDTIDTKGFAELVPYSNPTRPQWVAGTIANGSVDNSASVGVFNINATATISGALLVNNNTKGGTTGILLGAGEFASPRNVENGDVVNVTVTVSMTSV